MPLKIIFVDNNDSAAASLPEAIHKKFKIRNADSYKKAIDILKSKGQCGLVITELGLNNEDGTAFLAYVRKKFPRAVRMIMTARTDFSEACKAINSAQVYYFINKPCPADDLVKIIVKGIRHYEEEVEKKNAMRKALIGNVNALVDIVDLVNPEAMGFAKRIRGRVMSMGKAMGIKLLWQLELAVMLSHIGCVALPSKILEKMDRGEKLTPEEKQIFGMHPSIASNLLANIDQMAHVAEIILHEHSFLSDEQPLESRIIKIALDLDRLERAGNDPIEILKKMAAKPKAYDNRVVKAMFKLLSTPESSTIRELNIEDLEEGMIMAKDLINKDGTKLLLRGQPISKASLVRLRSFHIALGVIEPIEVMANTKTKPGKQPTTS